MTDRDLTLAMRLTADTARFVGPLDVATSKAATGLDKATQAAARLDRGLDRSGASLNRTAQSASKLDASVTAAAGAMTTGARSAERLDAAADRAGRGLQVLSTRTATAARNIRNELASIGTLANSTLGRLGVAGVGVGAIALDVQSARLDQSITRTGLTSASSTAAIRPELFRLGATFGTPVEESKAALDTSVAAGLQLNQALATLDPINKAIVVTGSNAQVLASGLTSAAANFAFDLSNPREALRILDQMTLAGRLGNAELENLSDIFARVGGSASRAQLSFGGTLALIEGLSQIERQPERLATLADSTLRVFTNAEYSRNAQRATGVAFFNPDGSRRQALDVLGDLRTGFQRQTTDRARANFIDRAFGKTDLDTQRGLAGLLSGTRLDDIARFERLIGNASGTLDAGLQVALGNAVVQTGRLRSELRRAADEFAQPINAAITGIIRGALDRPEDGGRGLSGEALLATGALGLAGLAGLARGTSRFAGVAGGAIGTAGGLAAGQVLDKAGLATPVFVVNFPASLGGGSALGAGAGAAGGAAAAAAARAGGGRALASLLGPVGLGAAGVLTLAAIAGDGGAVRATQARNGGRSSPEVDPIRAAVRSDNAGRFRGTEATLNGSIRIELVEGADGRPRARVRSATTDAPGVDLRVRTGGLLETP